MNHFGIYLQFQNANKFGGLALFKKITQDILGESIHLVVVDNKKVSNQDFPMNEDCSLPGDNKKREFSGYQLGLNYITQNFNISNESIIFFANDTFNVNYTGDIYLKLFQNSKARSKIRQGHLVGYVDRLSEKVSLLDRNGNYWVRTSFFSISLRNLIRILPFGKGFESEALFSTEGEGFFSDSPNISQNYKIFLKGWLFKTDTDQNGGDSWYSAQPLTKKNFDEFKIKAQCIFSEFLFTQDAISENIEVFDVRSSDI